MKERCITLKYARFPVRNLGPTRKSQDRITEYLEEAKLGTVNCI